MSPINSTLTEEIVEELKAGEDRQQKGQLERFLRIIGPEFSRIESLIDQIPMLFDPQVCPPEYLPHIARLVGWALNEELSIPQQREEVQNAVSLYKKKGTRDGLETIGTMVTGADTGAWGMEQNVLISNRQRKISAEFTDEAKENFGFDDDLTGYSWDFLARGESVDDRVRIYDVSRLQMFYYFRVNSELDGLQIHKLRRELPSYAALGYDIIENIVDPYRLEELLTENIEDGWYDEFEDV